MYSIKTDIKLILLFIFGVVFVFFIDSITIYANNNPESNDRINITINETNLVKNSIILLKDIARVEANGFLKEVLGNIEIGRSPKPGQVKVFEKNKILTTIERQQYLPKNIIFHSAQKIYVKRESQRISKQIIRQSIDQHLSKVLKNRDYQLNTLDIRGLENYPAGKIKLQIDSGKLINNQGKLFCHMKVIINGKKEDILNISGRVEVYEKIYLAKVSFNKGDIISKDNVYLEKRNVFNLREGFIKTFEKIDGKMVKSSMRKGDYFKKNLILNPPLIRKGDIVRLIVKNNSLLIVASGVSLENGFENQLIKVENIGSGKLVRGIVKEKSKVEVIY